MSGSDSAIMARISPEMVARIHWADAMTRRALTRYAKAHTFFGSHKDRQPAEQAVAAAIRELVAANVAAAIAAAKA